VAIWSRIVRRGGHAYDGECSHGIRRILLSADADDRLDTACHEFLHAVLPDHSEEFVAEVSEDLANYLRDLGEYIGDGPCKFTKNE
jgi:hypothetical protein